jgi:hypothetical protein
VFHFSVGKNTLCSGVPGLRSACPLFQLNSLLCGLCQEFPQLLLAVREGVFKLFPNFAGGD